MIDRLSSDEIVTLILALSKTMPIIILVDALDECEPKERYKLINAFASLTNDCEKLFKILVSSREEGDIVSRLGQLSNVNGMRITPKDTTKDIDNFICSSVEMRIKDGRMLAGNVSDRLKSIVIQKLRERADGMWVQLPIGNLQHSQVLGSYG